MHQEEPKRPGADHPLDQDLEGAEPVELLAPIEQDLQSADRHAQRGKAEPVELGQILFGFGQEEPHPDKRQNADRHVDVKVPPPAVVFGEPAAENRPDDRADHNRHAPIRHRCALALRRVGVHQHRLRQRHQGRAKGALDQPEDDDLVDRRGHSAQHRAEREADDRGHEQALEAKPLGKIAGRRRHDRGGDDVRGQHPLDLVLVGREVALDIGQRNVGNRGVERLHDRRQPDHGGDRDPVDRGRRGRCIIGAGHQPFRVLPPKSQANACGTP